MKFRHVFVWAVAGLALAYVAVTIASRGMADSPFSRSAGRAVTGYPGTGGTAVRILQFYANKGELTEGESATICYGVDNARSVRFEPAGEQLKPSWNRCFSVTPARDTTYTMVADGTGGTQVTASFSVRVKAAPPFIQMFAASEKEIHRGDRFTICYNAEHASSVRLEPVGMSLQPGQGCVMLYPKADMEFRLVASGAGGRSDCARASVRVR